MISEFFSKNFYKYISILFLGVTIISSIFAIDVLVSLYSYTRLLNLSLDLVLKENLIPLVLAINIIFLFIISIVWSKNNTRGKFVKKHQNSLWYYMLVTAIIGNFAFLFQSEINPLITIILLIDIVVFVLSSYFFIKKKFFNNIEYLLLFFSFVFTAGIIMFNIVFRNYDFSIFLLPINLILISAFLFFFIKRVSNQSIKNYIFVGVLISTFVFLSHFIYFFGLFLVFLFTFIIAILRKKEYFALIPFAGFISITILFLIIFMPRIRSHIDPGYDVIIVEGDIPTIDM